MSELKILIHLGHHLNVINLLGAVTKNIVESNFLKYSFTIYRNINYSLLIYTNVVLTIERRKETHAYTSTF